MISLIYLSALAALTGAMPSAAKPRYFPRQALSNSSNPDTSEATSSAYNCGCQSRKQQLEGWGATAFDLAVAFQETGGDLSSGAYNYGDNKGGAAANFGLFKNNWYMISQACPYVGSDEDSAATQLNGNDQLAIQCQHDQINKFGLSQWFAGQRCGQSGIDGTPQSIPLTQEYENGVNAILGYISQHMDDDMATSVNVPAISGDACG